MFEEVGEVTVMFQYRCDVCEREWRETQRAIRDIFEPMPERDDTIMSPISERRCPDCVLMMGEPESWDNDED